MSRGVLLMIAASLFFTLMVACVKIVSASLDTMSIIAWRGLIAVPLTMLLMRRATWRVHRPWLMTLRCSLGLLAMVGFYSAAEGLPLTELSFIHRLQPILIAVAAPLILGVQERVGGSIWVVLAAGILGCAVILGPQLAIGTTFGWWALLGTTASASAHLCVRALGRSEYPVTVAFWFQVFVLVVAIGFVGAQGRNPFLIPDRSMLWFLIGIGMFSAGGQMCMTAAYKQERAAVVGAATYLGPVFGLLVDLLIFAVIPGWPAFVGGAIILLASIHLLRTTAAAPEGAA